MAFVIRAATRQDIPALVSIHVGELPDDVLPRLGPTFLARIFFPTVLKRADVIALVWANPDTVGFVIFALDSHALTREVLAHRAALASSFFTMSLKDPGLIGAAIAQARGFHTELFFGAPSDLIGMPELYLMATARELQSRGIGGKLVTEG